MTAFRGYKNKSLPGGIEKVRIVCRIILWQKGWFERSKVCEQEPAPGGQHYVLQLYISMAYSKSMSLKES